MRFVSYMPPLVSVILPTYNREELLPRAINSVLAQTFQSWELLIWDDGSTDNTHQVVSGYDDQRIRYFFSDNHGVAFARNRALEAALGKYMAFLDSDDEWSEDKLADQVESMIAFPRIDVLFGDFLNINATTREKHRTFEQYASTMKLLDVDPVGSGLYSIRAGIPGCLAIENFIATDTIMIRREVIDKTGGFAETLRNMEDFELWWRMGIAGVCFAYMNKVHLTRYKLSDNLSNLNISTCKNRIKGLDLCAKETIDKGRGELLSYLNGPYRNAWQNMIPLYKKDGDSKSMLNAFIRSLRYGFRFGTIRLLVESILTQ